MVVVWARVSAEVDVEDNKEEGIVNSLIAGMFKKEH